MDNDFINHTVSFFVGVLSSIAAHTIIVRSRTDGFWFYRMIWSPPWRRELKPGVRGAEDLEQLIKLLGKIQSWLSNKDMFLIDEVRRSLWKAMWIMQVERFRYLAQFAKKEEERKAAIRELSLIDTGKARETVNAIISSPIESKRLKVFASQMLEKIDQEE
jgi:hypothetical protein